MSTEISEKNNKNKVKRICKFKNSFYLDAYKAARQGISRKAVADKLGITYRQLKNWCDDNPEFKESLTRGRQEFIANRNGTTEIDEFNDYVYSQLPEDLRVVLSMNVLGGMNSKQIGEALEIPDSTVRYRLSTARKKLVEFMEAQ